MVVKVFIILLTASFCFMLGTLIASAKFNNFDKDKDTLVVSEHIYEVKVRYLQSDGFIKTIYFKEIDRDKAVAQVLQREFLSGYQVFSVVSVKEVM